MIWQEARELIGSKKFVVLVVSVVLVVAGRLGFDLDEAIVEKVVALAVAYLVGQGLADFGKGKAQVDARAVERGIAQAAAEFARKQGGV